jgi:hypothetical protein
LAVYFHFKCRLLAHDTLNIALGTSRWTGAAPFDDPIPLPDGRVLKTLHDAGHYAIALPKAVQERVGWRIAAEMLIAAAEGQRPVMFAEIAVRQALHAGEPASTPTPRRKPART